MASGSNQSPITIRMPKDADGASIWRLVRDSGVLDLNSSYCYLMLCRYFADTGVVAEMEGELVGFVTAYIPSGHPDVLFVWQVGVDARARGRGVALAMLKALLQREVCSGVAYVETTVSPANVASRALFAALARDLQADMAEQEGFPANLFPGTEHEAEPLIRIGPMGK